MPDHPPGTATGEEVKRLSAAAPSRKHQAARSLGLHGIALYDAPAGTSVSADKAEAVVLEREKEMLDRLATKQDLQVLQQQIEVLLTRMSLQLTLRMGVMIVAAVTVLVAIQKLL